MRYRGSKPIHEPATGTGLVPIRNRPSNYVRMPWAKAEVLSPFEVFEQASGRLVAQDVFGRKTPLDDLVGSYVRVEYREKY